MNFLPDEENPYGHLDYLPNSTQDFINVIPELYNTDILVYFVLAANVIDFANAKTRRITPKEISEKLPDKSLGSIRLSLHRLKSKILPISRKPLVIQERDVYTLPDFRRATIIRNAKEQEKRKQDMAERADALLEKKAAKLGELYRDDLGYPKLFHLNRLKKEVIKELNLDFDPWETDENPSSLINNSFLKN